MPTRRDFYIAAVILGAAPAILGSVWAPAYWAYLIIAPLLLVGFYDVLQRKHTILRNFPVIGHGRYLMESIRPEIQQYFVEKDTDPTPISREVRAIVYQRAKDTLDTHPFGTQRDVYEPGYEWICHSLEAIHAPEEEDRVEIGGPQCDQPYEASRFNISAMSFGALSPTAVLAMNKGAAKGGFLHNTGEGGLAPYHLEYGADVCWQLGTAYFGARTDDGCFDPDAFEEKATKDEVKAVELKLSQGAKPGHGGILPGDKVSEEIAEIRGIVPGEDIISPPGHSAFDTPTGLLEFLDQMRKLSGGKPVGFKLCIGRPVEFVSICKAIRETGLYPDFITVDGKEGGTGAGPQEFVNKVGIPLREALLFVHNALTASGVRDEVTVFASSKILTGFDIFRAIALGADATNAARAMMLAVGCIQARRCNKNNCPTGVATQREELYESIDVPDKGERVYNYHRETVQAFHELLGGAGLESADDIRPAHIMKRVDEQEIRDYAQLYTYLDDEAFLTGDAPDRYQRLWEDADADDFLTARAHRSNPNDDSHQRQVQPNAAQ